MPSVRLRRVMCAAHGAAFTWHQGPDRTAHDEPWLAMRRPAGRRPSHPSPPTHLCGARQSLIQHHACREPTRCAATSTPASASQSCERFDPYAPRASQDCELDNCTLRYTAASITSPTLHSARSRCSGMMRLTHVRKRAINLTMRLQRVLLQHSLPLEWLERAMQEAEPTMASPDPHHASSECARRAMCTQTKHLVRRRKMARRACRRSSPAAQW